MVVISSKHSASANDNIIVLRTITVGATTVAELIKTKSTLKYLSLSNNYIGDDGISATARALGKIGINKLEVDGCGIALKGARALAELLSLNKNVTLLNLWRNPITTEGARLIFQSAVGNGVCNCVPMDSQIYEDDREAKMLQEILTMRKNKVDIFVSYVMFTTISNILNRNVYYE